jgi:hypothetical protein
MFQQHTNVDKKNPLFRQKESYLLNKRKHGCADLCFKTKQDNKLSQSHVSKEILWTKSTDKANIGSNLSTIVYVLCNMYVCMYLLILCTV